MAASEKPPAKPKTAKPKTGTKPKAPARKRGPGPTTNPLGPDPVAVRLLGDQLRGIAYLLKKLALAVEEKQLAGFLDAGELKAFSNHLYGKASDLRGFGDDGSNGG